MQNKKILLLFSVVLIAIILSFVSYDVISPEELPFMLAIRNLGEDYLISGWEDSNTWYFFLPGYVEMEEVGFHLNSDTEITLNGIPIYDGMSCADINREAPYVIEYTLFGAKQKHQVVFTQSDGVATMYLNTQSGNMEYIHAQKGNEESGSAFLYDRNGSLNCIIDQLTIKGRGNATWTQYDKKPYTITLDREADLLGMGKAAKWILLANAADHSHIRNKLVYDFAAEIGLPYSPESQWVDLYLNGEYVGLYLLCEKIEVHPNRVDIASERSFLVSMELSSRLEAQGLPYIETDSAQTLRVHYPEIQSDDLLVAIEAQWQHLENALISDQGIDPVSGKHFQDLADIESWIYSYLIDEIFGNLDGFLASRFFYFDAADNPKIYAGPVWDYDKSSGNDTDVSWMITNPEVMVLLRYKNNNTLQCIWTKMLFEHAWFQNELKAIFSEEMIPAVEILLKDKIDSYVKKISTAAQMDSIRWLSGERDHFDHSVYQLKTYLKGHVAFLKHVWLEENTYYQLSFLSLNSGGYDQFYTVADGTYLQDVPSMEDQETKTFVGWYYSDTDEPFDIAKPITADVELYAKWEDNPSRKIWKDMNLIPLVVIGMIGIGLVTVDLRISFRSCWRKS